jgi:MarR family transcriptional regulator, multiple antibiotic resistance protein MarR
MLEQAMAGQYYTEDNLQAPNSVGYLLKRCGALMTQIAERRFEGKPISFTQWIILIRLTQQTHISPTELAEHLGHDMGALTRIVDDLQKKGLVIRERSESDRRAVQITATEEGRRLALATKQYVVDLANELVAPYSVAETDQLISLLQRLMVHMEGMSDRA